jgi:hypothetical protein|uniref:Uncharacterized protein n=1 Tax=Mus musculus TaxID=10090 RepID=Q9CYH7_MOUSE|nr:unnamed protein product [Mus musculus]
MYGNSLLLTGYILIFYPPTPYWSRASCMVGKHLPLKPIPAPLSLFKNMINRRPLVPALRRQRQQISEFKPSLVYKVSLWLHSKICLKKKKNPEIYISVYNT